MKAVKVKALAGYKTDVSFEDGVHGTINLNELELYSGHLPQGALGLVIEWAALHQKELSNNWEWAKKMETLVNVASLV